MKFVSKHFYAVFLALMVILCVLSIGVSFWAVSNAERIHAELVRDQIYSFKKTFLHDTVQNMIRDIDRLRSENRRRAQSEADLLVDGLWRRYQLNPSGFKQTAMDLLVVQDQRGTLRMRLERQPGGEPVFSSGVRSESCPFVDFGPFRIFIEVEEEWVDRVTKATIADIIHNQSFEYNGYIWVNEVVDWNGGDGYAIRRIHPNLLDTEGCLLSTKTTDMKGNTPYLTELEGIKKYGELYYQYHFKRKDSDEIGEKLTYAALYPDYGWIVAMGMHIEDIETYTLTVRDASSGLNLRVVLMVISLLVLFFGLGIILIIIAGRRFMDDSTREIRTESNTDPLTGALNRRIGGQYFSDAFKSFKLGKPSPMIFNIDLDDFKSINDTFGHETGDAVLRSVVEQIKQTMRLSDFLFRWGGEEFILVYNGITPKEVSRLAERLNRHVASAALPLEASKSNADVDAAIGRTVRVSISIGASWFAMSDTSYEDAIKRSDQAMYRAKAEGKNCARVEPAY